MKKTYVKPMVAFENFQMLANVAGTCSEKANSADENNCEYIGGNEWTYFNDVVNGNCEMPLTSEHCYHVPTDAASIFAS